MEKIKKYIERFLSKHKMNIRYSMKLYEVFSLRERAKENPVDAFSTAFDYGYAKGYRAAMAEMKKGGVA